MVSKPHRSRGNALKHGLSARILVTDESARLNQLITLLAPDCDNKEIWHAARHAAEAWLYCERVSRARSAVIAAVAQCVEAETDSSSDGEDRGAAIHPARASDPLKRYERRAINQLEVALERLQLLLATGVR
jgi:hypothetical protein